MPLLQISLLSPKSLNCKLQLQPLFDVWNNYLPDFVPQKYGYGDVLRSRFNIEEVQEIIRDDTFTVRFGRKLPQMKGSLGYRFPGVRARRHADLSLSIQCASEFLDSAKIANFMKEAAIVTSADFGIAHVLNESDMVNAEQARVLSYSDLITRRKPFFLITTFDLQKYIPDIYWFTVLGPAYTRLFGSDRIGGSPGYRNTQIAPDTFGLQLTEKITDSIDNSEKFEMVRSAVKRHLNNNAIFDTTLGAGHSYHTPAFAFQTETS